MEKYGPFFQTGSAFVLKNVIVIATERNSYMIVTLNNLVKLYKVKYPFTNFLSCCLKGLNLTEQMHRVV